MGPIITSFFKFSRLMSCYVTKVFGFLLLILPSSFLHCPYGRALPHSIRARYRESGVLFGSTAFQLNASMFPVNSLSKAQASAPCVTIGQINA